MRMRCNNPNVVGYERYGGRGIKVCDRWNDFDVFLKDVGRRPSLSHTLDRIDNDGDYEPSNCQWATAEQQRVNTRRTHRLTINGKTMIMREWEKESGVRRVTILRRLRLGATPEQAVAKHFRVYAACFNLIPDKIRSIRERLNITQREAADRSGMNFTFWNMLETGNYNLRPRLSVIEKVAKALGCVREEFTTYHPIQIEAQKNPFK